METLGLRFISLVIQSLYDTHTNYTFCATIVFATLIKSFDSHERRPKDGDYLDTCVWRFLGSH